LSAANGQRCAENWQLNAYKGNGKEIRKHAKRKYHDTVLSKQHRVFEKTEGHRQELGYNETQPDGFAARFSCIAWDRREGSASFKDR
jgi:hypothetical protein